MTAAAVTMTRAERRTRTRQRVLGIIYLLVAVAMVIGFGVSVGGEADSTFSLTSPTAPVTLPDLVIPSAGTAYLLAAVVAFAGAIQLTRGFGA